MANVVASDNESFESLLRRFNKRVFYLRCAVENTTRSLALSASERKQPRDARVLEW